MLERSAPQPPAGNAIRLFHQLGLGSTQFARRYYGCRCCFPFLPGTEMFQFPEFPLSALCVQTGVPLSWWVSPFGHPRINAFSAAPRGFSQPYTSFIGAMCQGIHRWLFVAWISKDARARYAILKERRRLRAGSAGHQRGRPRPFDRPGARSWPGHRGGGRAQLPQNRREKRARKCDQLDDLVIADRWSP